MKSNPIRSAPISDEELAHLLLRHEEILLEGTEREWKPLERQVERLGFGDTYLVSFSQGVRGGIIKLSPARRREASS